MNKGCWDCCKFLVFIINFAALLAVGTVLGGAIYVLFASKDILGFKIDTDLSPENPTAIYFSFILIIIVVFAFLVIFTFLGCCGAACHNQCMIGSFIIILFIFLGANVAGIIYLFLQHSDEVEMGINELKRTIPYYDPEDKESLVKLFWDNLQMNVECCGAESWQDWSEAEQLRKMNDQVPASCCKSQQTCDQKSPSAGTIFMEGCLIKMELPYRIVFWTIPSLMLFVLFSSLIVCSRRRERQPRERRTRYQHESGDYTEETGYRYRASAPPYNPDYTSSSGNSHRNPYAEQYPSAANAEYRQPLIQPPRYHDVVQPSNGR